MKKTYKFLFALLFLSIYANSWAGGMDAIVGDFKIKISEILKTNGFEEIANKVAKEKTEKTNNKKENGGINKKNSKEKLPTESREELEAKVDELRDNYEDMKEIETSFENRMLGATGIASMGMGGMQLASAMSEEKADAAAEQQMKAYLATFSCTYADGKRFKGGESAIELPGGNDLIGLYSEYVNLANDLKTRKQALGLRAGIEAEPILDSATSGLYDDVATGKTSGAFASLARALSDPNGEDAAAWAAQKEATAQKKKTGLTVAGIGAAVSVAGNVLINRNNPKERSAEILAESKNIKKSITDMLRNNGHADIAAQLDTKNKQKR